jgi:hypothetical protein
MRGVMGKTLFCASKYLRGRNQEEEGTHAVTMGKRCRDLLVEGR